MPDDEHVYLVKKFSAYGGPSIDFIVNNSQAARKISFNHFLKDCKALEKPTSGLDALVEQEVRKQKLFIGEAYKDICNNFDPTIVKFKKKNKVIFSTEALSDLEEIGQREDLEEEPDK